MVMKTEKKKPSLIEAIEAMADQERPTSLHQLKEHERAEVLDAAKHVAQNGRSVQGSWAVVHATYPKLKRTTWESLVNAARSEKK